MRLVRQIVTQYHRDMDPQAMVEVEDGYIIRAGKESLLKSKLNNYKL